MDGHSATPFPHAHTTTMRLLPAHGFYKPGNVCWLFTVKTFHFRCRDGTGTGWCSEQHEPANTLLPGSRPPHRTLGVCERRARTGSPRYPALRVPELPRATRRTFGVTHSGYLFTTTPADYSYLPATSSAFTNGVSSWPITYSSTLLPTFAPPCFLPQPPLPDT